MVRADSIGVPRLSAMTSEAPVVKALYPETVLKQSATVLPEEIAGRAMTASRKMNDPARRLRPFLIGNRFFIIHPSSIAPVFIFQEAAPFAKRITYTVITV
jgi:hypothetical protein